MHFSTHSSLLESIEHWERNAAAENPQEVTTRPENCALCRDFYNNDCEGCPVAERTGQDCCDGSPYEAALYAVQNWRGDPSNMVLRDVFRAAAQAEVNFLRSLLP